MVQMRLKRAKMRPKIAKMRLRIAKMMPKIAQMRLKMAKKRPNQFVTSWKKQGLIFQLATKKKTPENIQNHFFPGLCCRPSAYGDHRQPFF